MPSQKKDAAQAAPITFVIPGELVAGAGTRGAPGGGLPMPPMGLRGRVKASVRVGLRRADGTTQRIQAQPGEDVVVLHLANGPTLVLHPENARDLMLAQGSRTRGGGAPGAAAGAAAPAEVEVPAQLRWQGLEAPAVASRGATRGFLGDVLLALVEVVAGPAEGMAQDWAADKIGQHVDSQVVEDVYALKPDRLTSLKGQDPVGETMPAAPDGGPTLVFVHGTFSDTVSGFSKLWLTQPHRVRTLFEQYKGQVFALDHATLRRSPIENALTLARRCPPGARLHLVTHSRGGLVAEVLARAAGLAKLDDAAKELFRFDQLPGDFVQGLEPKERAAAEQALASQEQALTDLIGVLAARQVKVERIVRVACPARGTLLASKRFDAYLSILKWALDLAQVPVAPALVDFIAGVAQRREHPSRIPGVAAMVPDSPLIRWLHAAEAPVPGQLRVIAGDLEGDSIGSWIKTLATDAFYWTDHDLVVQTRSMYGGAPREAEAAFVLDRGGKVTHFNYFSNDLTAEAVVNGLLQDRPAGYRTIGPLSAAGESATGTRAARRAAADGQPAADKPAVFVIPGILGSHIKVDGKRIWLGWRLVNGLKQIAYPGQPGREVAADGAIGMIYDDLIDFLGASHQVIEFSFDWRRPLEEEAKRLGDAVLAQMVAREKTGQPVRIVAHSMGGLLARTMALECPKVWERMMAHPKARLLMLGTPNGGSWAPMQCLSGDDSFGNTLVAFGAPFQDHAARTMMAQFPGFLQLQAGLMKDDPRGLVKTETWADLARKDLEQVRQHNWWHSDERQQDAYKWGVPKQEVLDAAVELRRRLDEQRDKQIGAWSRKAVLVIGRSKFTPDGYELGPEGLVYLNATDAGDGRVTRASAMLPGVATWRVDCEHGSLPDAEKHYDAYLELLEQGVTARLEAVPAAGTTRGGEAVPAAAMSYTRSRPSRERSGAPTPLDPAAQHPLLLPRGAEPRATAGQALRVSVFNGDLKFVRQPLMLGHYTSTQLTGTERVVDWLIGGTMEQSLGLRQYPDAPGTHQFFANAGGHSDNPLQMPRPESVVVVGMGAEGNLRPSELAYTVRMGTLALAQRIHEQPALAQPSFELAATLLGSGGAGISAGQAAQAIAKGVREADEALADLNVRLEREHEGKARPWPRVGHLVLVELYHSRAGEAWRALQQQSESAPGRFALADMVRSGVGALRRPLEGGYRGSDYDYIRAAGARGARGDALVEYTIDSRKRARTAQLEQPVQERLLRRLVAQASNDQNRDSQIGRTLFNLLVPVEMGPYLGGSTEMLLQVDPTTAGIPWELLDTDDGAGGSGSQPWALRAKLVRTLTTVDHRRNVVDASPDAHVLVIGEPQADPTKYPPLPGARREAWAVRDLLRRPGGLPADRVVDLVAQDDDSQGPDAREVINALMSRDWRIVHIAGHGMPPEDQDPDGGWCGEIPPPPDGTGRGGPSAADPRGVVLCNDTFLGPREIRSMRIVPELVFVNCCHLAGRSSAQVLAPQRYDRARFASGVAEALIGIGVRCVVAAGWAVEDEPAERFAATFYDALLRGMRFIDAVAEARGAAMEPGSNTWAAYQCYGDPDWVLKRAGSDPQRPTPSLANEFADVNSPPALALALETLAVECEHHGLNESGKEERRAKIRHLETRFSGGWGDIGAVAEAFAVAWNAAGDREAAIRWYRRALGAGDGSASMKASEQLANLLVREAWAKVDRARKGAKREALDKAVARARDDIDQALALLARLIDLAPSLERWSLCGSARKRLAMIERAVGDEDASLVPLAGMAADYGRALQAGMLANAPDLFYPALNRLSAQVAQVRDQPVMLDAGEVSGLRQVLQARTRDDPDFWSVLGLTELALYEAAATQQLHAQRAAIAAGYEALHLRTRGNPGWGSASEQLQFVLHGITLHGPDDERVAARALTDQVLGYTRASP